MHTKIITFNLFYLVIFLTLLGITPIGSSAPMLHFSWEGITIGDWNVGAFSWRIPIEEFIVFIVPIITLIIAIAILGTLSVVGSGLSFSPFKFLTLIIGIAVSVGLAGAVLGMIPEEVPYILKLIFVFPSVLMLLYSLVMDIGTWGGE